MQRETAMKLYFFIVFILHSLSYSGVDESETETENEFLAISELLTSSNDKLNKSVDTSKDTNIDDSLVTSRSQPKQNIPIPENENSCSDSLAEPVQVLLNSHYQMIGFMKQLEKAILPPKNVADSFNSFDNYKGESLVTRIESLEKDCKESKKHIETINHLIKAIRQQYSGRYREIQKRFDQLESMDKGKLFSTSTTSTATQTLPDYDIDPSSKKTQKQLLRLNKQLQIDRNNFKLQPEERSRKKVNPTIGKKRSSETAPANPRETKRSQR